MLETELQRIYDSEINVRIDWLRGGGIDVRLPIYPSGMDAGRHHRTVSGGSLCCSAIYVESVRPKATT